MTEPFSPAARAVLDAADAVLEQAGAPTWLVARGMAAALRAAADQVVPQPPKNWDLISTVAARECEIRKNLIAIAAELEALPE
jgi:hypothetical protein